MSYQVFTLYSVTLKHFFLHNYALKQSLLKLFTKTLQRNLFTELKLFVFISNFCLHLIVLS